MTTLFSILILAAIIIIGSIAGCAAGWAIFWIVIKASGNREPIIGLVVAIVMVTLLISTAIVMVTP